MSVNADDFKNALKDFHAGVTIVTAADADGTPVGATVSSFASLSLDPPLVLICLTRDARSTAAIKACRAYVVHVLDDSQAALARRFATDITDKFDGSDYFLNDDGVPCLSGCPLRLECTLEDEYDGGDHLIFVGRVQAAGRADGFTPLVYGNRTFYGLGTSVE